ncbi:MAG: metallopeptidase TldD-related protein [Polyangiaceae bacterium]
MNEGLFYSLADALIDAIQEAEVLLLSISAERSDFVRFNHARVRQAGRVEQATLSIELVRGKRHASANITLCGDPKQDLQRSITALRILREQLPSLPEDPHLLYSTNVQSTTQLGEDHLPEAADAIDQIISVADGVDLVGIWASGEIAKGFANSLGQRNWFRTYSFHLDWSLYHQADKASKNSYAGTEWDRADLEARMGRARTELEILARPPHTIAPGAYRAYLAPAALLEIVELLSWGGFGLKAHRSKVSPLMRAVDGTAGFDERIFLDEHAAAGLSPGFNSAGFIKPDRIQLIKEGRFEGALVSARSAKEYDVPTNGASASESPNSLEMAPGSLAHDQLLDELSTGIWINNLWYLNYSDRPACRMTGMTRFATMWVENGEIVAPLNVMRFDDSAYRILGEGLIGLTRERELLLSASTYGQRSTGSARLPGVLVEDFRLTL